MCFKKNRKVGGQKVKMEKIYDINMSKRISNTKQNFAIIVEKERKNDYYTKREKQLSGFRPGLIKAREEIINNEVKRMSKAELNNKSFSIKY